MQCKIKIESLIQKHFFIALFITKSKYYLCSVLLIISENSGKFLHSANFIPNVGGSRKPKSNETSIFAPSRQSRWIFSDHAVFYVRSLPSENTADFAYYLSYTIAMNSFDIVSRLTITNLSCDFATLKNLLSQLAFRKNFPIFLFFCLPRERYQKVLPVNT